MTQRLPIPGGDDGDWGDILNGYLGVSLYSDGTLNPNVVSDSQVASSAAINPTKISGIAEVRTNKNQPSGYAGLNSSGFVPVALIPDATTSVPGIVQLAGDLGGSGTTAVAPTLANTSNVQSVVNSIIATNTTVAGALQKTNNLSDVNDPGYSRANLHVPVLTPAACVSVTNVASLSGLNTYDGYTLVTGDTVLLVAQSTASQNGVWIVASGSWIRPTEFASGSTIKGRSILITNGATYGNTQWSLDAPTAGITIDTTSQTWNNLNTLNGKYTSVFGVAAPTGAAATDAVNIQTQINNASSNGGGIVQLQIGTYALSSTSRIDSTVTYYSATSGSYPAGSWQDSSITSADVGSYVIGIGINGRSPKILTVVTSPVTYFTTDIAPGGTISASAVTIVNPGIVLPDGVTLQGIAAPSGDVEAKTVSGGTTIVDSGTGVSIFLRGGDNIAAYFGRSKIKDLGIWGSATYGSVGSTLAGIWANNNTSFLEIWDCDISGHYQFGLALDYNINSLDCHNTGFSYCGHASATSPTGGVGTDVYNGFASAAINFYNCWGYNLWGWFIALGSGGQGSICLYSCQWNGIKATSAYLSGSGVEVSGPNSVLVDCWSETCASYDVIVGYGYCTIIASTLFGGGVGAVQVAGSSTIVNLIGIASSGHSTAAVVNSNAGHVSWMNCHISDSVFLNGVATPTQAGGIGTTSNLVSAGTVPVPNAVTVTTNAGTIPVTSSINTFTNSSSAAMSITLATSGAVQGQQTIVQVYDYAGTTESITWVNTENSTISVPTTSNGSTTSPLTVEFIFNAKTTKWRCIRSV